MLCELVQKFIPIAVFGDVANEKAVVIEWYRHTQLFAFPQFKVIQLKRNEDLLLFHRTAGPWKHSSLYRRYSNVIISHL